MSSATTVEAKCIGRKLHGRRSARTNWEVSFAASLETLRSDVPYNEGMARRVTTIVERIALLEHAPRATSDEATTLTDGRRLDSREAVKAWLADDVHAH